MSHAGTLIYDDDCAFCRRWVRRLQRWDAQGRIVLLPLQHPAAPLLGASRRALEDAMHFVRADGAVFAGAAAVPELLKVLPVGWILRLVFRVPGVLPAADHVYRWVARRRHRLGCESAHCRR